MCSPTEELPCFILLYSLLEPEAEIMVRHLVALNLIWEYDEIHVIMFKMYSLLRLLLLFER